MTNCICKYCNGRFTNWKELADHYQEIIADFLPEYTEEKELDEK